MMSYSAQDDRINYNAFYPKTFLFLVFIAVFSHRRRSLQLSGAFTAILMGHLTMANPNPIFGGALLSFFALGTFATKYKQKIKAGLWMNPNCYEPDSSLSSKLSGFIDHFEPTHTGPLRKALISAALAYWAGRAGDTLASEIVRQLIPVREPMEHSQLMNMQSYCSQIDSVLGATLQQTVYSKKEKRVVAKSQMKLGGSREIVVICGHDLLTNNQVNLVSSTTTGILAGLLSYYSIMP
ncbi:hypothetical protein PSHT_03190 [Puccinia striiformis]|uniref:Uncharacterized protein n=1 Tax=Puccinia striiformis TaxID=27350 RepID=A0A2S4WG51_9BASI|nr:hypothetical protein PSHT_03190 [Puccinia striiformis]